MTTTPHSYAPHSIKAAVFGAMDEWYRNMKAINGDEDFLDAVMGEAHCLLVELVDEAVTEWTKINRGQNNAGE